MYTDEQRVVARTHELGFLAALQALAEQEPRLSIRLFNSGSIAVYVDGGREHAYVTHSVLSMATELPTAEWVSMTSVTYSTDDAYYTILDEDYKRGVYRDPAFCAAVVLAAVNAHVRSDFVEPGVSRRLDPQFMTIATAAFQPHLG